MKANTDKNQSEIVEKLRQIPGMSVELNHDDILVGFRGLSFWYELKSDNAISKKTGEILESHIEPDQERILKTWRGHYKIVSSFDEIFKDITETCRRLL
jgi:hypothetical protein